MASSGETYSQFRRRRSNQPENGDYGQTQAASIDEGISINRLMAATHPPRIAHHYRHIGVNRHRLIVVNRRLEAFYQHRDAHFQQVRHANHMNSEGNLSELESQSRIDHLLNPEASMTIIRDAEILESVDEDEDEDDEIKATPTAKSFVNALKIKKVECEKEIPFCVICQELMNVGDFVQELPCVHNYHVDCIQSWLATRNTCPVCRLELPTTDHVHESGEE